VTQWLINAIALALAARWLPGVALVAEGREAVFIILGASAVLGLLNLLLKPVLILITLPVNVLSLGLFTLVINGVVLLTATTLVPGFTIDGFWHAVLAALFLSVTGMLLNALLGGSRLRVERGTEA
jgi:putative membrane protein